MGQDIRRCGELWQSPFTARLCSQPRGL